MFGASPGLPPPSLARGISVPGTFVTEGMAGTVRRGGISQFVFLHKRDPTFKDPRIPSNPPNQHLVLWGGAGFHIGLPCPLPPTTPPDPSTHFSRGTLGPLRLGGRGCQTGSLTGLVTLPMVCLPRLTISGSSPSVKVPVIPRW